MTITAKPRKRSKSKYYVYYNDWTGEILSVGNYLRTDTPAKCILTEDLAAGNIVSGIASDQDYIVGFDSDNKQKLIRKSDILRLRKQEEALFLLPEQSLNSWDIRVRLYKKNAQLVIEINSDMVSKLVAYEHQRIILTNRAYINFYLIRRNDPDYLIKTISVDAEDLINYGKISFDINDIITSANMDDISILTRRYFKNYYFELFNDQFVNTDVKIPSNSIHQLWQNADNNQNAHIVFTQKGTQVEVESLVSAEQLTDVGMNHTRIPFYLVGEQPDDYLQKVNINIAKIRMGQKENFTTDYDIMNATILFQNSKLKIKKRKI